MCLFCLFCLFAFVCVLFVTTSSFVLLYSCVYLYSHSYSYSYSYVYMYVCVYVINQPTGGSIPTEFCDSAGITIDVSGSDIDCYSGCLTSAAVIVTGAPEQCNSGRIMRQFLIIVCTCAAFVLVITLIFRYSGHVEFVLGRRCVSYIMSLYTVCTDSIVICLYMCGICVGHHIDI